MNTATYETPFKPTKRSRPTKWSAGENWVYVKVSNDSFTAMNLADLGVKKEQAAALYFSPKGSILAWQFRLPKGA